ncbi:hypothetical protein MVEN_01537500 [Mycena venus]|uniref:Uncharacterized protein n=1 Tax=Mycena venus TaxID=2733690 RepID=A0A8H7CRR8_9AGAR|nr:hypothetical protein MVEN_01537500 [Mycena venus]
METEQTGYTSYPISCHDIALQSVVTYGFIVDGHLHRLRLKNSLEKLIVNQWNILGARIGKNAQDRFEYRVPSAFNDEVEAFSFDSQTLSTPLSDHFQIPPPTSQPSLFTASPSVIFEPPAHLKHDHLSSYEKSSQPILHLQVMQFSADEKEKEKTSIGLTVPQCFCDAGGIREILSAWSSVLAKGGITEDIPTLADGMMLEKIEPEVASHEALDTLWTHHSLNEIPADAPSPSDEREVAKWMFMPTETLARLTRESQDELAADGYDVLVGEADVLLAWWTKTIYSTNSPDVQNSLLAVSIPLDLRSRLPAFANQTYLHNAIHMATHVLPSSSSVAEISLSQLALALRTTIRLATSEEITRALAYKTQTYYSTKDHSTVATLSPPGSEEFMLSNWLDMNWILEDSIDFRPALMGQDRSFTIVCDQRKGERAGRG